MSGCCKQPDIKQIRRLDVKNNFFNEVNQFINNTNNIVNNLNKLHSLSHLLCVELPLEKLLLSQGVFSQHSIRKAKR